MASYNVICAATDGAYVDATDPGSNFYNSTEWRLKNNRWDTLIKFDNSGMQSYRRKKIVSLQILLRISASWGDYSGFTLSPLKSSFNGSSVTYNSMPENDWMLSSFQKNGSYEVYFFDLSYYQGGQVGLGGVPAIRSFFDQIPIGFRLSNVVPGADKVNVDDRFRSILTTDTYPPRMSFGFEDWNPTLTTRIPVSGASIAFLINNTLSVSFDAFESIDYPTVSTVTYEVLDVAAGTTATYTSAVSTNLKNKTYCDFTMPVGTLTMGKSYKWRAKLTTEETTTVFSNWSDFTTTNITPSARFPVSGAYVVPFASNNFSVLFGTFDADVYPIITGVTYEIKDVSTGVVTSSTVGMWQSMGTQSYCEWTIAANTLAGNKTYQWRANIITNVVTLSFSAWATFSTVEAIPGTPAIISPQSKYLDGAAAIALTWQHNIDTGSAQHAYDLDYKQTGGWVSLAAHAVSSVQSFTVPAGTFMAGTMYWRVRTYNTDNVVGDYGTSTANVVQAKPVTPIIQSITVAPRSTINWQSVGQQAYQLTVKNSIGTLILDTGETYGTAKSVMIDDFLSDGNYAFDLTIQNGQGMWSDYATQPVHIANSPPSGEDVLTATSQFGAVKLDLILPETKGADYVGETYVGESYLAHQPYYASGTRYVLRDGIVIAKISGTSYTDYTAYEDHQYIIRIVTSDGNYFDTNVATASPTIKYACISKFASPQNVLTLKLNEGEKPVLDRQLSKVINSHYFAGRTLAVQDVTEHHDSAWSFTYSFTEQLNYKILEQLFFDGETVMFRDSRGYKAVGTIGSLSQTPSNNANIANFSIAETDASEVITYD